MSRSMTDAERIAAAKPSASGRRMLGPLEKERCPRHPRRWVTIRWVWAVPANGDHQTALECGEAQIVHACTICEDDE